MRRVGQGWKSEGDRPLAKALSKGGLRRGSESGGHMCWENSGKQTQKICVVSA